MMERDGIEKGLRGLRVLLVCNAASGSNDENSQAEVHAALTAAGVDVASVIQFPHDGAPDASRLDADGIEVVVTFGGDGTTHAVITGLFGWTGSALVLPGGTMNLLSKALHGDAGAPEIIARLARGPVRCVRPPVISTRHGVALTGVLAGPGAIWNEVREALREASLLEVVSAAREAISHSTNGPKVVCEQADCGRGEGYAAITINPHESGLEANGYYAESLADFAGQGIALLNRNFRNGPHDVLGVHDRLRLVCPSGEPMGLLIDGEPFDGGAQEVFRLATCGLDLLSGGDAR